MTSPRKKYFIPPALAAPAPEGKGGAGVFALVPVGLSDLDHARLCPRSDSSGWSVGSSGNRQPLCPPKANPMRQGRPPRAQLFKRCGRKNPRHTPDRPPERLNASQQARITISGSKKVNLNGDLRPKITPSPPARVSGRPVRKIARRCAGPIDSPARPLPMRCRFGQGPGAGRSLCGMGRKPDSATPRYPDQHFALDTPPGRRFARIQTGGLATGGKAACDAASFGRSSYSITAKPQGQRLRKAKRPTTSVTCWSRKPQQASAGSTPNRQGRIADCPFPASPRHDQLMTIAVAITYPRGGRTEATKRPTNPHE